MILFRPKLLKYVLLKFNDNELPLNQSFIISITLLISSLNFEGLGFAIIMMCHLQIEPVLMGSYYVQVNIYID